MRVLEHSLSTTTAELKSFRAGNGSRIGLQTVLAAKLNVGRSIFMDTVIMDETPKPVLALDWDGTVTESVGQWFTAAVMLAKIYKIYIVTMRYPSEIDQVMQGFAQGISAEIIATGRKAKMTYTKQLGIEVNVWIDDNPKAVLMNALEAFGGDTPEGHVVTQNFSESLHG